MKIFNKSTKLNHVAYDVRGPVLDEAMAMEAAGERILKLNIGNPAPFGFSAPMKPKEWAELYRKENSMRKLFQKIRSKSISGTKSLLPMT